MIRKSDKYRGYNEAIWSLITTSGADPYLFPPFHENWSYFQNVSRTQLVDLEVQNIIYGSMPRIPLEAFAFTCIENRSPFILDLRL